jgi:3-methylfumaryl-CoA hydratase
MSLSEFDLWVERAQTAEDLVTPRLIRCFEASLEPHLADLGSEAAPLGLHWCLAPDVVDADKLGPDGHPARGDFLPPVPLPRRMWAGGALVLHSDIREGDRVERASKIAGIKDKSGRTGRLCFVTVEHEYRTPRGLAVEETQSIVYREESGPGGGAQGAKSELEPTHAREATIDPVLLFRYSALTFNGHRIHYDAPYAIEKEHYSGVVLHGPLQATFLLNLAAVIAKRRPRRFSFRGVSPASGVDKVVLNARLSGRGAASLWIADPTGGVTMTGSAEW